MEIPGISDVQENVFLIDWLTFVAHGYSVDELKSLLGFGSDIPWEDEVKFRNGYPLQTYWNGITFSYGAEQEKYYKDPTKARSDMGVCVNFSGTGCRAFESYGHGDWFRLLADLFTVREQGARLKDGQLYSFHITRIDLAYDDHIGYLDINLIRAYLEDRYYTSPSKYSEIVWSDNQLDDIIGLTCQVGSNKSDVKIRIYDKAAERGFKDRHWVRCELQLRNDRAMNAASSLVFEMNIGATVSGILRNYLMFRTPSSDDNKSRWPVCLWWETVLEKMERIKLWISPGEPYNFSRTELWLCKQYGQAIVVLDELHDPGYLIDKCRQLYPVQSLSPKYRNFLAKLEIRHKPFDLLPPDPGFVPSDIWGDQDKMEGFL